MPERRAMTGPCAAAVTRAQKTANARRGSGRLLLEGLAYRPGRIHTGGRLPQGKRLCVRLVSLSEKALGRVKG